MCLAMIFDKILLQTTEPPPATRGETRAEKDERKVCYGYLFKDCRLYISESIEDEKTV